MVAGCCYFGNGFLDNFTCIFVLDLVTHGVLHPFHRLYFGGLIVLMAFDPVFELGFFVAR